MLVASPTEYTQKGWGNSSPSSGKSHYRSNSYTRDGDSEYTPSKRPVTRRSAAQAAAVTTRSSSGSPSKAHDAKRVLDGAGSVESWNGIITTTKDALLIIEACRQGVLPILMNRPKERERDLIRSGSIIVFMENQSGMKRWRDGFRWTPSRIATPFLIYRQLDDDQDDLEPEAMPRRINDMNLKKGGLVKKALSLAVDGTKIHMISYFTREDEAANTLPCPSNSPVFASIQISDELWTQIQHDAVGASSSGSTDSPRRRSEQHNSMCSLPSSTSSLANAVYPEQEVMVDPSMMRCHDSIDLGVKMESELMLSQFPVIEEIRPENMDPFWVLSQVTNANMMGNMAVSNFGGSIITPHGLVTTVQVPASTSSLANTVPFIAPFATALTAIQPQVIPGQPTQLYEGAPMITYQPIMIATQQGQPQQYSLIPVAAAQPDNAVMPPQSFTLLEAITAAAGGILPESMQDWILND